MKKMFVSAFGFSFKLHHLGFGKSNAKACTYILLPLHGLIWCPVFLASFSKDNLFGKYSPKLFDNRISLPPHHSLTFSNSNLSITIFSHFKLYISPQPLLLFLSSLSFSNQISLKNKFTFRSHSLAHYFFSISNTLSFSLVLSLQIIVTLYLIFFFG